MTNLTLIHAETDDAWHEHGKLRTLSGQVVELTARIEIDEYKQTADATDLPQAA